MRKTGTYWLAMLIDIMFILSLRYIKKYYDSDTYWYSLVSINMSRVLVLWVMTFFAPKPQFNKWEKIVFILYFIILLFISWEWITKTAAFLWPH